MSKYRLTQSAQKVGLPPGTLLPASVKRSDQMSFRVIEYSEQHVHERQADSIADIFPLPAAPSVIWLHISGLSGASIVEEIGRLFAIHPLVLEDILDQEHRPKLEDYEDYCFIVLKMAGLAEKNDQSIISMEQVSIILGNNYVISFQGSTVDIFAQVRERLKSNKGRMRKAGPDYLAYALLDTVVDHYYVVLEAVGEQLEFLEDALIATPGAKLIHHIHGLKSDMLYLRRSVWPLREVINAIIRGETDQFQASTTIYVRDLYDHTIQVIETMENYRDMLSAMVDIYLSSVNNKLSEVMKFLTIISTIFIPLTFIAGVYGMNFKYMPELEWQWGYPVVLAMMVSIGVTLAAYFRIKKWY